MINFVFNTRLNDVPSVSLGGEKCYPYFICFKLLPKWYLPFYESQIEFASENILNMCITKQQIFTFQRFIDNYHQLLNSFDDDVNFIAIKPRQGMSGYTMVCPHPSIEPVFVVLYITGLEGIYQESIEFYYEDSFEAANESEILLEAVGSELDSAQIYCPNYGICSETGTFRIDCRSLTCGCFSLLSLYPRTHVYALNASTIEF